MLTALGSWSPNGKLYAVTIFDGSVVVGGDFDATGSFGGAAICKWHESNWTAVGSGAASTNATITALAVFNGELIAGGLFTSIGGTTASNIARWNGASWQTLGSGTNAIVNALYVFNNELYAGGAFDQAGGINANRVAKWNGSTWNAVGTGFDNSVSDLKAFGGDLYAGGSFTLADGNAADHIARWSGSAWQSVGGGLDGDVECLKEHNGALFVGGTFGLAGGNVAPRVASWNGSTWSAVGNGVPGFIGCFGTQSGQLIVGGQFSSVDNEFANNVARWDNSAWHALGSQAVPSPTAIGEYQADLVVAGSFTRLMGVSANGIARLAGNSGWQPLGAGVVGTVRSMIEFNSDLIVAGSISSAGGNAVNRIARWDGTTWNALDQGIGNGTVNDLVVFNGVLYAGGTFTTAGGAPANRVAAWDGSTWTAVGAGLGDYVTSLEVYNGELVAGGRFMMIPGENPKGLIARWDGSSWLPYGGGLPLSLFSDRYVNDITVFNGQLIVVGRLSGDTAYIWSGTSWGPFGSVQLLGCNSFPFSCPGFPLSMASFGNDLYVSGEFAPSNPAGLVYAAKSVGGGTWQTAGVVIDLPTHRVFVHDEQLFLAGSFTQMDSRESIGFARYGNTKPLVTSSEIAPCDAESITLQVSDCQPGPMSYQWRKDGYPLSNGGNISGAQSSTMVIAPPSGSDVGVYDVLVAGSYGQVVSTSLSVFPAFDPPQINNQPSGISVCTGAPINIQVTASGGTPAFQWRKNGVNLTNGGRISGATTNTLTITPSLLSDTDTYDVIVTNGCGDTPSDSVAVLVQSFPIISSEPEDTAGCAGDPVMLSLSASVVPPVTYQWRKGGFNLSNTSPYSGVNTPTLTINPASEFDNDNYDCVITDACNLNVSAEATVTVSSSPPIIGFGPDPVDTCAGQYVSLAAMAFSSPSPTYQWRKDGDPIDGATGSFIEFLEATAADSGQYDVVISNGCGDIIPPAVQVNVFATATADGNLDATANGLDIPGFLDALLNWDFVTFSAPYCAYDMNADAYVDNSDIPGVVAIILGS